tara:strand:- start:303 stop:896 length:594 start_codon:yes stop_codon:yes gene_type:complete
MATSRANKNISQFKSKLIGGGARPNLFEVELTTLPPNVVSNWDADIFQFMCKAASLPAQNIANIDIPFRGRIFKVAGDRTIDTWTITVINDEDFRFRNAFENWTQQIANLDDNMGTTDPSAYMVDAKVYQLGRGSEKSSQNNSGTENVVLKEYEFQNIFPTNVSAIDLSYDTGDTIEEFTVEFQVQSLKLTGAGNPN